MFILIALLIVVARSWSTEAVIWVEHGGLDRVTHVNNKMVSCLPADVLQHYHALGYRIAHHTMAATDYRGGVPYMHYSWILLKDSQ